MTWLTWADHWTRRELYGDQDSLLSCFQHHYPSWVAENFGLGRDGWKLKVIAAIFYWKNVSFRTFRTFATEVLVIIGILYVCILGQRSGPVASCQNISKFGQTDSCHTHVYYICRVTSATLEFVPTDQTSLKLCCKIWNDSWVIPLHYSATRKRQFELVNIKVHKSGWLSLCFCDAPQLYQGLYIAITPMIARHGFAPHANLIKILSWKTTEPGPESSDTRDWVSILQHFQTVFSKESDKNINCNIPYFPYYYSSPIDSIFKFILTLYRI